MLDREYESELFIDFLITRNNTKEIMKQYKKEIMDIFDYNSILIVYQKIATSNFYSSKQIDNFKDILNFIIDNRANEYDEVETMCLKGIVEDTINIEPSYNFYYQEFIEKYNNFDNLINDSCQMINKKEIEETVQFDYLVYKYLTGPFSLEDNFSLIINPYFLLSINKFLYEKPLIFSDENIKKRTINTLNIIEAYYKDNNIEFDNKHLKYLLELVELEASPVDLKSIKEYNMKLLLHKIMIDNRKIDNTEYKDLILTDYFIENLNDMLLKFKNNGIGKYYSYNVKERLEYVLMYILNNKNDNKTKIKYNEIRYLLNQIEFSTFNAFLYDEAEIKYSDFEIFKRFFIKLIFGRDLPLEEDMRISVGRDYDVFQLLFSKKEIDESKIDPYYARSIKKFQIEIPEIFGIDDIVEKVDKIMNSDKVLKKR